MPPVDNAGRNFTAVVERVGFVDVCATDAP
jgi:hypothetical protein